MSDQLYRDIILEHWKNPQNFGTLHDADIDVSDMNPLCGDEIRIMLKTKSGTVKEVAFTGEGCAISKASASLFTEEIKGKTLEEIKNLKPQDALDLLGITLTPSRTKCALLVYSTLEKGLSKK